MPTSPSQDASLKDARELCLTLGLILDPLVPLPLRTDKGSRPPVWDPGPRNGTALPVLRSCPFSSYKVMLLLLSLMVFRKNMKQKCSEELVPANQ